MSLIKFILTGDVSGLEHAGEKGQKALGALKEDFKAVAVEATKWGAATAAAAVVGLTAIVKGSMDAIGAQADFAQSLRTTATSIAVLERAGDLAGVSVEQLAAGTKKLDMVMAQAASGAKTQSDLFKQLGLDVGELSRMTLDQRILAVNQALAENIPATQRAAAAAALLGEEAGLAVTRIDPDTLREAAKQAQLLGTALTDVEAEQVAQAGDSLSTLAEAAKGAALQFTVKLAPVLKVVGDLFLKNAEQAGGMGRQVTSAFDKIVAGAAFVMNAADGIKRVFQLTADGIIWALNKAAFWIADTFSKILFQVSKLPGVDFTETAQSLRTFADLAQAVTSEAAANINNTLNAEMTGDAFKRMVKDAEAASKKSAEAAVAARKAAEAGSGGGVVAAEDPDAKRREEAAKRQQEELDRRLEAIRTANLDELTLLEEKYAQETEIIEQGLENRRITEQQAQELSTGALIRFAEDRARITEEAARKELEIEKAKEANKKQVMGQALSGLTTLMNSESRKMFEIGKAAAIAQSVVSTWTGATKALELGYPLGPIAAGAIVVAGMANIANIRKQQFNGGGTASANAAATPTVPATAPGGGGNAGGGGGTPLISLSLVGDSFSGQQVYDLIDKINGAVASGARLRTT